LIYILLIKHIEVKKKMTEAWIIDACRTPRGIGKAGKGAQPSKTSEEEKSRRISYQDMSSSLMRRAEGVIRDADIITPYTLASSLNIRLSLARKVIRQLASEGKIKVIDKSKSLIVAVPAGKGS
jgi:small subunit ribosomal protein S25e